MHAESFDLVVLGTGAAGSTVAQRCHAAGRRVAIVDDQPYGGTCALRGCDPKKVLVDVAELRDLNRRMLGAGMVDGARIDWPALMRFKSTFTDPIPAQREAAFRQSGITTYHDVARFAGEDRLSIGGRKVEATHVVIATGSEPRPLGIPGEVHARTSTDFLELGDLPRRIVLIGAGYIAFELAHIARRVGAEVVILGRSRALASFDQDLVQRLVAHTRALGVDVRLNAPAIGVEAHGSAYRVRTGGTEHAVIETDLVVHAAGRVPMTRALELQTGRVRVDSRGAVQVNEYLQSVSNSRVYAAGDAVLPPGSLPLTPVAAHEGVVVASNLLHRNQERPDYRAVPSVVFTVPPLARVGLTERDARERKLAVRVKAEETGTWFSQRQVRETTAMFKTVVEEATGRILGAHLLGPHADEVINVFALAIRHHLTASNIAQMIYAYPTSTSDIAYMV